MVSNLLRLYQAVWQTRNSKAIVLRREVVLSNRHIADTNGVRLRVGHLPSLLADSLGI
ncbi:MAG: hypothetical protein KDA99_00245 [Planctomycetales bacterium]|nr:hypothetical protein [Planctomycetales bacterium]